MGGGGPAGRRRRPGAPAACPEATEIGRPLPPERGRREDHPSMGGAQALGPSSECPQSGSLAPHPPQTQEKNPGAARDQDGPPSSGSDFWAASVSHAAHGAARGLGFGVTGTPGKSSALAVGEERVSWQEAAVWKDEGDTGDPCDQPLASGTGPYSSRLAPGLAGQAWAVLAAGLG